MMLSSLQVFSSMKNLLVFSQFYLISVSDFSPMDAEVKNDPSILMLLHGKLLTGDEFC